ncbi:MAG: hypothetical protein ACK4NM_08655, partial [Hydrogenophaga sp.]
MHKLKGISGLVEARRVHTVANGLEDLLRTQAPESAVLLLWPPLQAAIAELQDTTAHLMVPAEPMPMGDGPAITDTALAAFREMLLGQDLDALAFFAQHRAGLAQRLGAPVVQRMADLLDALAFEQAADLAAQASAV